MTIVDGALRLAIGGLFIYAGAAKAANPARFAFNIDSYQLLPMPSVAALALYLPWLEIACGLSLIVRRLDRGAIALLLAMLAIFIAAAASAAARGIDISCGCFGSPSAKTSALWLIGRNMLLIVGMAIIVKLERKNGTGGPQRVRS
jgi:uncharacterized membrane protein YphA (DoxX/SURF4 family)